jgi:multiple sugar transport system substrate-binding protein
MMYARAVLVILALILAPLGAKAADLVVWWDKGYYPEEDAAVAELVAAFEQKTGKRVELVSHVSWEMLDEVQAAIDAGRPPDFIYGIDVDMGIPQWAYENRLVELDHTLGSLQSLFDPDLLEVATLANGNTGRRALYALPMGRITNHVHVWKSLLEQAGFTQADIPREWDAFWAFWCDKVQPAVRRVTGRDDIWGVGLAMSVDASDVITEFDQFQNAYRVYYADLEGRLTLDDPDVRAKLVRALDAYTRIYLKGCIPPDALTWDDTGNNKAFLAQRVVMTANGTLSIPNALKSDRPNDYWKNMATVEWPKDARGQPQLIFSTITRGAVFNGAHAGVAKDFVLFLVADGWLANYVNFTHERLLPPMSKLLNQPFWLDPSDPHRMAAAIQVLTKPRSNMVDAVQAANWRLVRVNQDRVWGKAIHRVAADGVSPEQAVDEAIARIKQILSE